MFQAKNHQPDNTIPIHPSVHSVPSKVDFYSPIKKSLFSNNEEKEPKQNQGLSSSAVKIIQKILGTPSKILKGLSIKREFLETPRKFLNKSIATKNSLFETPSKIIKGLLNKEVKESQLHTPTQYRTSHETPPLSPLSPVSATSPTSPLKKRSPFLPILF